VLQPNVSEQFLIVNLFSDSENIGVRDKAFWLFVFFLGHSV